ncbi:unnamed protein product, partial [Rotaria sp. Silwood1]
MADPDPDLDPAIGFAAGLPPIDVGPG